MHVRTFRTGCSALLVLLILLVFVVGGYFFFKDLDGPTIEVFPNRGHVSPAVPLTIRLNDPSGVRSLRVDVRKNNNTETIFEKYFEQSQPEQSVEISLKKVQLREGAFDLEIRATDSSLAGFGMGNTRTELLPMQLDNRPPRLFMKALPPNVRRGGTGVVRYSADEALSETGIYIGEYFLPSFPQKDGTYICFFPFPYTMTARDYKNALKIMAKDLAGNTLLKNLNVTVYERKFRSDKINVSDSFLQNVKDKLGHLAPPESTPLECYLYINREVRAANARQLFDIGKNTSAAILWDGAFVRLPRSATRAGFADHRYLYYQSKMVGEAFHLGLDLASIRNADVPAANNGRVVFTGDSGIYGNLIVIDHGLRVMSLYSHLSEIRVNVGDVVSKGQIIASTGTTGLAFGDHLHFGILVGGIEVTPIEWIDPKWIKDNVTMRLEAQATE